MRSDLKQAACVTSHEESFSIPDLSSFSYYQRLIAAPGKDLLSLGAYASANSPDLRRIPDRPHVQPGKLGQAGHRVIRSEAHWTTDYKLS